jgi:hypothetical protein
MHQNFDYSKSAAPHSDAVIHVRDWFGDRWDEISPLMKGITDPHMFRRWAAFAGIEGFPVEAWYDLYRGRGAYRKAMVNKMVDNLSVSIATVTMRKQG